MDNLQPIFRATMLWTTLLLTLGSSGCSYRNVKHRMVGLAGYGCPTCGADKLIDCKCSFHIPCAGYQPTLWGEVPTDCLPPGDFAFAVHKNVEEKPAEAVLPAEPVPADQVNPLPDPLDLDPAPALPSGTPPAETPQGRRETDPAPPLFNPDQSTPNPFPLRDENENVPPPSTPDLFDDGDKSKSEEESKSPNPFPLKPQKDPLKEDLPDLFQKNSKPSRLEEGNVVRFGRILHAAPPATSQLEFGERTQSSQHRQVSREEADREGESQTILRLGPVHSQ